MNTEGICIYGHLDFQLCCNSSRNSLINQKKKKNRTLQTQNFVILNQKISFNVNSILLSNFATDNFPVCKTGKLFTDFVKG